MKDLVPTHVGHRRCSNEKIIALDGWNLRNRSLEAGNRSSWANLADEMGGHVHGEAASELTVRRHAAKDVSKVLSTDRRDAKKVRSEVNEIQAIIEAEPACPCTSPSALFSQFRGWRDLDQDSTEGRYADVQVLQCVTCSHFWLRYHVEYEAFSRSGRWARGMIDADTAKVILPGEAPDFLAALPSYLYGGSRVEKAGERSGPMNWSVL